MKKNVITIIALLTFFVPHIVLAQTASPQDIQNSLSDFADPTGIEQVGLTEAAGGAVEAAYGVMGLIFFVLAIYAGVLWMTAQGQEDRITKARNILVGATIGLTIVVGAYGITTFISERAIANLSTGGGSGTIQEGAGGGDGELEASPEGCCVYRNSDRRREFVGFITTASTCETEVNEFAADNDLGSEYASSDDHDWFFYGDVQSLEQCTILETCWDRRNRELRGPCIRATLE